ncbi:MAG: HTH domain-containing protein [Symbiobacteriia bacterium]
MKKAWQEGKRQEVISWLAEIRSDGTVGCILSGELKARLLRLQATIELASHGSVDKAKSLAQKADEFCTGPESHRLKALIVDVEEGPQAALDVLDGLEDLNSFNLRLALLIETGRSNECAQTIAFIQSTLEPDAETYRLMALHHLTIGKITDARSAVQEASRREAGWRSIRFTVAMIDYFDALSPVVLRGGIQSHPSPVPWDFVRRDDVSRSHLEAAHSVFSALDEEGDHDSDGRRVLQAWKLACLANDTERQGEALEYCQRVLHDDPANPYVLAWVGARKWSVNLEPSKQQLELLAGRSEATCAQVLALAAYHEGSGDVSRSLALLVGYEAVFNSEGLQETWRLWMCRSYVASGDLAEARRYADLLAEGAPRQNAMLMILEAETSAGGNWRELADYLRTTYQRTGDAQFLFESCSLLTFHGEWGTVAEEAEELIGRVSTAGALALAAPSLYNCRRFGECLDLLDRHSSLFPAARLPNRFRRLKVACQQELGLLPQAVAEAQALANEEPSVSNLLSLAQVLYSYGDLRGISLVARQVETHPDATPEQCLHLARLVQWDDQSLSASLWRKAAQSNPFPDELIGEAVTLAFQLALDTEVTPLMSRLDQLSETQATGVRKATIDDMIEDLKQRNESGAKAADLYARGEIPIHVAAEPMGVSLAALYHGSLSMPGPRDSSYVQSKGPFIRYGGKPVVTSADTLPKEWRLNLDVTSILLVESLGLLSTIQQAFSQVRIPSSLMPTLIAMRDSIAPHQPSRARVYEEILGCVQRKLIQTVDHSVPADEEEGYIVDFQRNSPSLAEDHFPAGQGSNINCRSLIDSLRKFGPLSETDYDSAINRLGTEGNESAAESIPRQGRLLRLSPMISEVLARADLLEVVCQRFTVEVGRSEIQRIQSQLDFHKAQLELSGWLGNLINSVRDGISKGKLLLLPAFSHSVADQETQGLGLRCLLDLMSFNPDPNDVIWVDDRYVSSYGFRDGVPLVGITEILHHLRKSGHLTDPDYYNIAIRLRSAGFRFLLLDSGEIVYHLGNAELAGRRITETSELTTVRRYVSMSLSSGSVMRRPAGEGSPGEMPFVLNVTREVERALAEVWKSHNCDEDTCTARANWILENLYLDLLSAASIAGFDIPAEPLFVTALSLASLVAAGIPLGAEAQKDPSLARRRFFAWLERRVLQPKLASEPLLLKALANQIKGLLDLDGFGLGAARDYSRPVRQVVLQGIYDDLPEQLREELSRDSDFMSRIGLQLVEMVRIGNVSFDYVSFVSASTDAVNGRIGYARALAKSDETYTFTPAEDGSGIGFSIRDSCGRRVANLTDEIFGVLCDAITEREQVIKRNSQWLDAPRERLADIASEIAAIPEQHRRLQEVDRRRKERVVAYFENLREAIQNRNGLTQSDLKLPQPERFCSYLGFPPTPKPARDFALIMSDSAAGLLADTGLELAINRLSGLPVPLPSSFETQLKGSEEKARKTMIKHLLKSLVSPVSRVHLVRLLVALGEPRYIRLARRIASRLAGSDWGPYFKAFVAVLRWADSQSYNWSLASPIRIAVVWAQADLLFSTFVSEGVDVSWIEEAFGAWLGVTPLENIRRQPDYWYDICNPRLLRREPLVLLGLGYALGSEAEGVVDAALKEKLADLAFLSNGNVRLPGVSLLEDPRWFVNSLDSFLGADRHETLNHLLGGEAAELLAGESIRGILTHAVATLEVDPSCDYCWAMLRTMATGNQPYPELGARLAKVAQTTRFGELGGEGSLVTKIALLTATLYASSTSDSGLKDYLTDQIAAVALLEFGSGGTPDATKPELVSVLVECLLNLSMHHGDVEKSAHSLAARLTPIARTSPRFLKGSERILLALVGMLPTPAGLPLWELLNMARGI